MPNELTRRRRALKREACALLGIDPTKVRLRRLTNLQQFINGVVSGGGRLYGQSDPLNKIIWTRGNTGLITYVHELLHLLYRRKPHWWVFGASYILADRPRRALPASVQASARISRTKAQLMRRARARAERVGLS